MNNKQIFSIKQAQYVNLIIDETQDISVKQMICICLRYVEQDSGEIKEDLFKLAPILDTSGEGMSDPKYITWAMKCILWF
jgi:hypothetical protein